MHRAVSFYAALAVLPVFTLAAQAPPLSVGHRVRLKTDSSSQWLMGTLVTADEDSLGLRVADNAPSISVARRNVSQFEVSYPGHSNAGRGALIGLTIGALGGAIVGGVSSECQPNKLCIVGPEAGAVVGAVLFGGAGALLGAGIGAATRSDNWVSESLGRARVTLVPRGAGLALSLTF
jgi:hypothetical protein